jgi:hypothetical protein
MKVVSSNRPVKPASKARPAKHKAFDRAWNKVIQQQQKNASLREEIQAFSLGVSKVIQADEKAYVDSICRTCEHLLQFGKRKSMSLEQRATLLQWIMRYVTSVAHNPFSEPGQLVTLHQAVDVEMQELLSHNSGKRQTRDSQTDPMVDDLDEDLDTDPDFDPHLDDADDSMFEESAETESRDARKAQGQALNDLMRGSSINKVFRKVARSLHPDREPDEGARVEKNRLMGLLLQARDNNDVPAMFALYAEHVGESPLRELADDLEGVTQLLLRQYDHLRAEENEIVDDPSLAASLYRRFHRKSGEAVQREISKHRRALQFETLRMQRLREDVNTVSKLKRYLGGLMRDRELDDLFE